MKLLVSISLISALPLSGPRVEARNGRERVRSMESPALRHTCLKLHIDDGRGAAVIFVKGTWLPTRFELFITDGLDAWICSGLLPPPLSLSH